MATNVNLLLFHGELLIGIALGILLGLVTFPALALWMWKRPPRTPAIPAIVYLLAAVTFHVAFLVSDNEYLLIVMFALTFPFSFLLMFFNSFIEIALAESYLLFGAVINAFLIYWIGLAAHKRDVRNI